MANELQIGEIKRGIEIGKPDQRRAYIWQTCPDCGESKWARIHRGQPVSNRCMACANRKRLSGAKGEKSIAWHGGISKRPDGYIKLYNPNYSRADSNGYVLEHIYIWEQAHNQSLPNGWVIHHLNGIKDDNRPENLLALPIKKHKLILAEKAKRIRELEAKIKLLEKALNNNQMIFLGGN